MQHFDAIIKLFLDFSKIFLKVLTYTNWCSILYMQQRVAKQTAREEHDRKEYGFHGTEREHPPAEGAHARVGLRLHRRICRAQGYPPTLREIADALGLRSTGTVVRHLKHLEAECLITRQERMARAISTHELKL